MRNARRKARIEILMISVLILAGGQPLCASSSLSQPVSVGYGWSVKNDVGEAVAEAVSMMNAMMTGTPPDWVTLFSTIGYNSEEVLEEMTNLLGDEVKIYGGTSCLGVMTKDGLHIGEVGSLAILGVTSPRIQFGVSGVSIEEVVSAREQGRKAILEAISDAGRTAEDPPQIVLITGNPGEEEEVLKGIEEVIGKDVPLIGGSSADNEIIGEWKQYANDRVYSTGVALTVIYTDLKLGWAYEMGYLRTANQGVATKSEGRTIYEIDSRPAAVVYNEWIGGKLDDVLETGGDVLLRTTFYPLAKIVHGETGETYYISIHPLSIELPEKSLTVFADIPEGTELSLFQGNWELLLNRAYTTPMQARTRGDISVEEAGFAIFTFCAGTMLAIPEDERAKIPLLVKNIMGETPFIGTFAFGEQGFLPGVGNVHGNLASSMVTLGKE